MTHTRACRYMYIYYIPVFSVSPDSKKKKMNWEKKIKLEVLTPQSFRSHVNYIAYLWGDRRIQKPISILYIFVKRTIIYNPGPKKTVSVQNKFWRKIRSKFDNFYNFMENNEAIFEIFFFFCWNFFVFPTLNICNAKMKSHLILCIIHRTHLRGLAECLATRVIR